MSSASAAGGKSAAYRIVETYLFDTCTLKCGYCWLAENGQVLDAAQLIPFRDPNHIDRITSFFNKRTTDSEKWHLQLTGGEPLLMPNFERFCSNLFQKGNRISLYTALIVDKEHPSFRFLASHGAPDFDYLMCSFHPQAEQNESEYWRKIEALKGAGHHVIVRFVGHPKRIPNLERLSRKCQSLDVAFYPTTLFSPNYPHAYSNEEREQLSGYFSSLSQAIQLAGGLDTSDTKCYAGSKIIATNLRFGDIWPCISVQKPVLGNVYEDRLELFDRTIACPNAGMACNCDVHYQQNIVIGAEDNLTFERIKVGYTQAVPVSEQERLIANRKLRFSEAAKGIGNVTDDQTLVYSKDFVKEQYLKHHPTPVPVSSEKNGHLELASNLVSTGMESNPNPAPLPPSGWERLRSVLRNFRGEG